MPWIGITINEGHLDGRQRLSLPTDYARAVAAAGGSPLPLPSETILSAGEDLLPLCDGFLLSGGGDLDPALYGQQRHPATGDPDLARDQAELALVRLALAAHRPLLGICRGIQAINVALGGDLIQDLPSAGKPGHDQTAPRAARTHLVTPIVGMLPNRLCPGPISVNSFHHQGLARLGAGLQAAALAEDGLVEAVILPGKPMLAVQWHPENYAHEAPEAAALFAWLVKASAEA